MTEAPAPTPAPTPAATPAATSAATSAPTRASKGARLFHSILLFLGVRTPYQKLYDPDDSAFEKACEICRRPCRFYTLGIFTSLFVLPIASLFQTSDLPVDLALITFASELILPVQYFLAVRYFGSTHFQTFFDVVKPVRTSERLGERLGERRASSNIREIFVEISERHSIADALDFNFLIKHPCRLTIRVVSGIILFVSLTSFCVALFIFLTYEHFDARLFPFFVISRLHGRATCVVNTSAFAFVFYKHVKVLDLYSKILEQRDWSCESYEKVSLLLVNLMKIRESLGHSTSLFKSTFASATIAGAIIIGAFIHSSTSAASEHVHWSYEFFVLAGSFVALQVLIFSVIAQLSFAKERIEDVTKSSKFAMKFLVRKAVSANESVLETATTVDYFLIVDALRQPWLDFSVMGVPLHSLAFLKQCISLASIALVLAQTQTLQLSGLLS